MPPKAPPKKPLPKTQVTKPLSQTQTKKPLPKTQPPKKQPQPPEQTSWLTRTTNAAASGVGNFAGAIVSAAGNGIAGAGKGAGSSLANTSRGWADAVREYGNSIKDVTGASGSRATTKTNPLGLASTGGGAKAVMASRSGSTGGANKGGSASNPLGL